MNGSRSFASDNNAGVHPEVLKAIAEANQGHAAAYGDDSYTASATDLFKRHFGQDVAVFFVFNGTAANCLSLRALTESYQATFCAENAHINVDECGAPEKLTGSKLVPIQASQGKLTVDGLRAACCGIGDQHRVQPKVISITQATEVGTVYRPEEVRSLAGFAHERGMLLHVDGARIANAAASLDLPLGEITGKLGVDVLSFGATKNGALGAEAVVFFDPGLAEGFKYHRKQSMQLASKMRFLAVQFEALLKDGLWLRNARHSNRMARLLEREIGKMPEVKIVYRVEANGVFAEVPRQVIRKLQERYFFYVWDEERSIVRWMCSWDTTEADIREFAGFLSQLLQC
ncbi:MAG: low specificity L-threonine aldolase [Acidobacteria bacterium]|nr:low specificity L-threonine aldolase [Acidobacteriota bacterium]MBV9625274.1 low specificity L-threonine aldolase [Acidobacteriota bacterium]